MDLAIINKSSHALPAYETLLSAGMDIRAFIESAVTIKPGQRLLIPTGLYIALPPGYEAQIRPRSGLAFKNGVTVLNAPGTIDADYRGEIKVMLINHGTEPFEINNGDRIAQMIIATFVRAELILVETLNETDRGSGGFGSTGK